MRGRDPTTRQHPLRQVHGVPECALSDAVVARLPDGSPPAPWRTLVHAVLWVHRASPRARELLGPALRGRPALPLTIGAFVRYLDSPVGPYSEVLASPLLLTRRGLPAASVPFIAVDSTDSLHGGRANWALPKTLARFDWSSEPERSDDGAPFSVRAQPQDAEQRWSIEARVATRSPAIPLRLPLRDVQAAPDGRELTIAVSLAGHARLAQVQVADDGPTLPRWLRPGRHHGIVLERARMTFAAPS